MKTFWRVLIGFLFFCYSCQSYVVDVFENPNPSSASAVLSNLSHSVVTDGNPKQQQFHPHSDDRSHRHLLSSSPPFSSGGWNNDHDDDREDCTGPRCFEKRKFKEIVTELNPCLNVDFTVPVIGRVHCKNKNLCSKIPCDQNSNCHSCGDRRQPVFQSSPTAQSLGMGEMDPEFNDNTPDGWNLFPESTAGLIDDDAIDAYAVRKKDTNIRLSSRRLLQGGDEDDYSDDSGLTDVDINTDTSNTLTYGGHHKCEGKPVCCDKPPSPNENPCQRELVCCSDWKTPCVAPPKQADTMSAKANVHFCDQTVHWQLDLFRDSQHYGRRHCADKCGLCEPESPPPDGLQLRWDFYANVSEISMVAEGEWLMVLCNMTMYIEAFDIHDPSQAVTHFPTNCIGTPVDANNSPLLNHSIYVVTDPQSQPVYTRYDVSQTKCTALWNGCPPGGCQCTTFIIKIKDGCSQMVFPTPLRPDLCTNALTAPVGFAIENFFRDRCDCVCKITKPPLVPVDPNCKDRHCNRQPRPPIVFLDIGRNYEPKKWSDLGSCASLDPYRFWPRNINAPPNMDHYFKPWLDQAITWSRKELTNVFVPNRRFYNEYDFRPVVYPHMVQFSPLRPHGLVDWVGYGYSYYNDEAGEGWGRGGGGEDYGVSFDRNDDPHFDPDDFDPTDPSHMLLSASGRRYDSSNSHHERYPKCMVYSIRKRVKDLEKTCTRYSQDGYRNPLQLFHHEKRYLYDGSFVETVQFWVSVNVIQEGHEWDCLKREKCYTFTYREGCSVPIQKVETSNNPNVEVQSVLQPIVLLDKPEESKCPTGHGRFLLTWRMESVQPYPGAQIGLWNTDQVKVLHGGYRGALNDPNSCFEFSIPETQPSQDFLTLDSKWDPSHNDYWGSSICDKLLEDLRLQRADHENDPTVQKCLMCNKCHTGAGGRCEYTTNQEACLRRCRSQLPDVCFVASPSSSSTLLSSSSDPTQPSPFVADDGGTGSFDSRGDRTMWVEPPHCDKYSDRKGSCVQFLEMLTNCHELDSRFYSQCARDGTNVRPISLQVSPSVAPHSPVDIYGNDRLQSYNKCHGDCNGDDHGCRKRCDDDHDEKGRIGPIYINIQNNITVNNCIKITNINCRERSGWHCWDCDKRHERPEKCCPNRDRCDSCCKDACCDNWVKPRDQWSDNKNRGGKDVFVVNEECSGGEGEAEGEAKRGRYSGIDNGRRRCVEWDQWGNCCKFDDNNPCDYDYWWVWWVVFAIFLLLLLLVACCYTYDEYYGVDTLPVGGYMQQQSKQKTKTVSHTKVQHPATSLASNSSVSAGNGQASVSTSDASLQTPLVVDSSRLVSNTKEHTKQSGVLVHGPPHNPVYGFPYNVGPVASASGFVPYNFSSADNPYALYGESALPPSSYTVRPVPAPVPSTGGVHRAFPSDNGDEFMLNEDMDDGEEGTAARAAVVVNRRRRKHSLSSAPNSSNKNSSQTNGKEWNEPGAEGTDLEFHTD